MSVEVKVPALPESIADAVIAHWHKQSGDAVKRDENLVDLETDKVILEVPAVTDGVLSEIRFEEGTTVTPDQVLAVIDEAASSAAPGPEHAEHPEPESAKPPAPPQASSAAPMAAAASGAEPKQATSDRAISPSARKLMADNDVDASKVSGSGRNGRVLKEDVAAYLRERDAEWQRTGPGTKAAGLSEQQPAPRAEPAQTPVAPAPGASKPDQPGLPPGDGRIEKRVPMTRLRARIAERLLEAQHNAAILTTFNEVNMKPIMELRNRYKERFEKEHGVKLGFMSFFVSAAIEALKKFPAVNASIDGNDIVYHGYFDIGVAVSGPSGLVVPVLRSAETMSLAEIEQAIIALAGKAKDNRLSIEEITGGTFTISNGGIFGSMLSTPILNPPQSAILGMHTIKERPMVVDGEVVVLPMMYLALSYDHRIIDGREAVQFLVTIRDMLEDPSRMLLGI